MAGILIASANAKTRAGQHPDSKQEAIIRIAALTGKGDLSKLNMALTNGLEGETFIQTPI